MADPLARIPYVDGVLTAEQVAETAASIAAMQEPSGAVPWTTGEHTDIWNHVEAAMAMLVGGQVEAAERAYAWVPALQRADGSWPMKIVGGEVEDDRGEVNMSSYLAVGIWHHWLVRRDIAFVHRFWPVDPRRPGLGGLDAAAVRRHRLVRGVGGRPARSAATRARCWPAPPASTSRCGPGSRSPTCVDDPQPEWELAGGRLGHAIREHRDLFLDKSTFSMDWYYPVLGGAVRGDAGRRAARDPLGRLRRAGARHPAASTPTPGSPAPRPASWRWRSTRWATTGGRCALLARHAAPARARTASTGPAGSTATTCTGRSSRRRTPRPR